MSDFAISHSILLSSNGTLLVHKGNVMHSANGNAVSFISEFPNFIGGLNAESFSDRAAEVKAARDVQEQGERAPVVRESSKVFFVHLAGYKARPVSLQSHSR